MSRQRRPAATRAVPRGPSVPAGDTRPGDLVELDGRRLYVAAHLAGRVALEPLGPGGRRGGLSGSSVWVEPGDAVTIVEAYRARDVASGSEYDPLQAGVAKNINDSVSAPSFPGGSETP